MARTKISRNSIKKYSKNKNYFSKGGSRSSRGAITSKSGSTYLNKTQFPNVSHLLDPVKNTPLFDKILRDLFDKCNESRSVVSDIQTRINSLNELLKTSQEIQKKNCDNLEKKVEEIMKKSVNGQAIITETYSHKHNKKQ